MMRVYIGAGKDRKSGFLHMDRHPFDGIDIVADVCEGIPLASDTVDEIFTQDFMEHIPSEKKIFIINEMWRVLVPGGTMEHWIPNAGSRNDFGSPTHLSHWNLQQFEHFDINSYRYNVDHEYEGFIGRFTCVVAETASPMEEVPGSGIMVPQSIHVIYKKC